MPNLMVTGHQDIFCGEAEKSGRKYVAACQERGAQYTLLCFSVNGMWEREGLLFFKRMADQLARNWENRIVLIVMKKKR